MQRNTKRSLNVKTLLLTLIAVLCVGLFAACRDEITYCTVSFSTGGASEIAAMSVVSGESFVAPTPVYEGFSFGGWYYDANHTSKYHESDPVTADCTLYAQWCVTVSFETGEGSSIPDITVPRGISPVLSTTPTHDTLTFCGWYYDDTYTTPFDTDRALTSSVTLYAKYLKIVSDIYSATDLLVISNNPAGKYTLKNDIDLGGVIISPLCSTVTQPFSGTFDGGGFTISNYRINGAYDNVGLFATVTGSITNLTVEDVVINVSRTSISTAVGALAGTVKNGTISECTARGSITIDEASTNIVQVGGLVGLLREGTVEDSSSSATVTVVGTEGIYYVGGLVGHNVGTIANCYSSENVSATATIGTVAVGGLVGYNSTIAAQIAQSHALGDVTAVCTNGFLSAGGFVGYGYHKDCYITYCYAEGDVGVTASALSDISAGGFAGSFYGVVSRSYATGDVTLTNNHTARSAQGYAGGFIGHSGTNTTMNACFATGDIRCNASSAYAGGFVASVATGLFDCYRFVSQSVYPMTNRQGTAATKAQLCSSDFYTATLKYDIEVTDIAAITADFDSLPAYTTDANPIIISTVQEYVAIPTFAHDYYQLAADLDFQGATLAPKNFVTETSGLDGAGHRLSAFTLQADGNAYGLVTVNCGMLKDIVIKDFTADLTTNGYVDFGVLCAYNTGTIEGCSLSEGQLSVSTNTADIGIVPNIGGMVGHNTGTISHCFSTMNVNNRNTAREIGSMFYTGGLVGYNDGGILEQCGVFADVTANSYTGGVVGLSSGEQTECAMTGTTKSQADGAMIAYAGGIVGAGQRAVFIDCFVTGNVVAVSQAKTAYAGGIVAIARNSMATTCYVRGSVRASAVAEKTAYSGGITGYEAGSGVLTKCLAVKDITAESADVTQTYGGGLFGYCISGSIKNGYLPTAESQTITANTIYSTKNITNSATLNYEYITATIGFDTTIWSADGTDARLTWVV